jgi:hypothetical protein
MEDSSSVSKKEDPDHSGYLLVPKAELSFVTTPLMGGEKLWSENSLSAFLAQMPNSEVDSASTSELSYDMDTLLSNQIQMESSVQDRLRTSSNGNKTTSLSSLLEEMHNTEASTPSKPAPESTVTLTRREVSFLVRQISDLSDKNKILETKVFSLSSELESMKDRQLEMTNMFNSFLYSMQGNGDLTSSSSFLTSSSSPSSASSSPSLPQNYIWQSDLNNNNTSIFLNS